MSKTLSRILKFIVISCSIFLITLFFFLLDTLKTSIKAVKFFNSAIEQEVDAVAMDQFSKDLMRYSQVLGSPVSFIPSAASGSYKNGYYLSTLINPAAQALSIYSNLQNTKKGDISLSNKLNLEKNSKYLTKISKDLIIGLNNFSRIKIFSFLTPICSEVIHSQKNLKQLEESVLRVTPLIHMLPDLLGFNGKRKYFVAMQNSAQARGTGGLLGTFSIISINEGKVSIDLIKPNEFLAVQPDIPINVPADYRNIYGDYARNWNGSNFSPHFPYAAQIWLETWYRMTGERLDGAISVDTFVLQAMLAAAGSINIENTTINESNVIQELLSNAYLKFEKDPAGRKIYLSKIAGEVANRFIVGSYSGTTFIRKMIKPLNENRVLIYLRNAQEEKLLSQSPLSGILDNEKNNEYRLILQNIAGNKLDYYMKRKLKIVSKKCLPDKITHVEFEIKNVAKSDQYLPPYVSSLRAQGYPYGNKNTQYAGVFLYGPTGSKILRAYEKDSGFSYGWQYQERGRSLYSVQTMIPAGESKSFVIIFSGGVGPITSVLQPLVQPQTTLIVDRCRA